MTEIMEALTAFWAQFGVPVYTTDQVPPDAELPYITFTASNAQINNASIMTAYNWQNRRTQGHLKRLAQMDEIARAIPNEGVFLPLQRGYLVIRRNTTDFQIPWQDPENPDVIGGRTSCEVYFYNP